MIAHAIYIIPESCVCQSLCNNYNLIKLFSIISNDPSSTVQSVHPLFCMPCTRTYKNVCNNREIINPIIVIEYQHMAIQISFVW